jgi:GcrA cell cycle regulator
MITGANWTEERVQQLRTCVDAGLTCSQIAAEIGVTRNAVIGKIHRLGLSSGRRPGALARRMRAEPVRPRARPTRLAQILRAMAVKMRAVGPSETTVVSIAPMLHVESAQRCSLLDLTSGRCRWPISDPGKADFGFCGNDTIAGISYCAGHARLAYRLPSGRRA